VKNSAQPFVGYVIVADKVRSGRFGAIGVHLQQRKPGGVRAISA
jgi:hypothetical protein